MDPQQAQADNEALASALSAISHPHSTSHSPTDSHSHHFHHPLTAPDFSQHKVVGDDVDVDVDVENLEIPVDDDGDLGFGALSGDGLGGPDLGGSDVDNPRGGYGRPPSIRKGKFSCSLSRHLGLGFKKLMPRCYSL